MTQKKIENPNPDCARQDCKFTSGVEFTTLAYYTPLYDKTGNLISTDSNITSGAVDCVVCGGHWTYITVHGITTYTARWDNGSNSKT
jgi:hypothetical protein